jgi:hypothetical protein
MCDVNITWSNRDAVTRIHKQVQLSTERIVQNPKQVVIVACNWRLNKTTAEF